MKLTRRYSDVLDRMAAGFRPFSFQLSGLEKPLLREGLVEFGVDDRGNTVLDITEAGRAAIKAASENPMGGGPTR